MKVLKVCSGNNGLSPFVKEQALSLRKEGLIVDIYQIKGNGVLGYLKNFGAYKKMLNAKDYDIVHAHYGLSGLLANLQRKIPVVTTFHGSDTHYPFIRKLSIVTTWLSKFSIITNDRQFELLKLRKNTELIPCGVDTGLFVEMDKMDCRKSIGLAEDAKIVLFGSSFERKVKNVELAKTAIEKLNNVQLVELKGYDRKEVAQLINASDIVLVTSFNETGPLIIKEALACNTPVISTDVGDVKSILGSEYQHLITSYDSNELAKKINELMDQKRPSYREMVLPYDLKLTAKKIKSVYNKLYEDTN